jgi:hypothetical protein
MKLKVKYFFLFLCFLAGGIYVGTAVFGQQTGNHSSVTQNTESATLQTSTNIVHRWETYFKTLHSFEYSGSLTYPANMPLTGGYTPPVSPGSTLKMDFAFENSHYYARLLYPATSETKKFNSYVSTYDGKNYQSLQATQKGQTELFIVSPTSDSSPNYSGADPFFLLFAFTFAGKEQNVYDISMFKKQSFWDNFAQKVQRVIKNKNGNTELTVYSDTNKQEALIRYEVEVDNATGLPKTIKIFTNQDNSLQGQVQVDRFTKINNINFATTISAYEVDPATNSLKKSSEFNIDVSTLKVNTPIDSGIFTIPKTQADIIAEDGIITILDHPKLPNTK